MKRLLVIGSLLAGLTVAPARTPGQEPPERIAADPEAVAERIMRVDPMRNPDPQWFREAFNPALREQREIRKMLAERNTAPVRKNTGRIRLRGNRHHVEPKLGDLSIGNTAMDNFSPFPDRLLDARTLRFPMPRK